tara:strand:+ start:220 stop:762 length:543 start_codon:yes stop_codon:yes gene_type:complete
MTLFAEAMTFSRDVKCDSCGQTETIRTTLIYRYALAADLLNPGCAIPTWCFDCNGIRDSEQLPAVERLSQLLTKLETNGIDERELNDKASFLQIKVDSQQEYENELARRRVALMWRSQRRSQPRCLVCGGTNHSPIQWSDGGCEHPGCNGRFTTLLEYHSVQANDWEVDAEGNRLPEQNK